MPQPHGAKGKKLSDDAEKITSKPHSPRTLETASAQQKEKT